MKNKSILIIGISGFLGYHLYNELYENNNIVGIFHSNRPDLPKAKLASPIPKNLNLNCSKAIEKSFKQTLRSTIAARVNEETKEDCL